jgi:hypothetical protein
MKFLDENIKRNEILPISTTETTSFSTIFTLRYSRKQAESLFNFLSFKKSRNSFFLLFLSRQENCLHLRVIFHD